MQLECVPVITLALVCYSLKALHSSAVTEKMWVILSQPQCVEAMGAQLSLKAGMSLAERCHSNNTGHRIIL